ECLSGTGEIDLSKVSLLSKHHYLWSQGFTAGLKTLVSSKTLSSDNRVLKRHEFPDFFQLPAFKGSLCELDEMILNVPELIESLRQPYADFILKAENPITLEWQENLLKRVRVGDVSFQASRYIFTAGAANEALLAPLQNIAPRMQRRPLHMVCVKMPKALPVFAHYVGNSTLPRITITTHPTQDGGAVWYLGGAVAESGLERSEKDQCQFARAEIAALLPWLDQTRFKFRSFIIDRAEGFNQGKRPDNFMLYPLGNTLIGWPTKLTLAPAFAEAVLNSCQQDLKIQKCSLDSLDNFPRAHTATPPWEEMNFND
ncbi:MAG: FAD-dependent oxidoreductase, partial [Gammaproteobacteria bacterium]|nr:FAD-dependent oxidoreductase [Gammaproteobacteria bacterium]